MSGNKIFQSESKEFEHLILFLRLERVLSLLAVCNHKDNLVIPTLAIFISTPKRLFSIMSLSIL